MVSVSVSIPNQAVDDVINQIGSAIDTERILDEAGAVLLNRTRTRFLSETDPDNVPWIPSFAAIRRRAKGGTGTLFDTGRLFHSIQLHHAGDEWRSISTDVSYAPSLIDRGWPFLGFNQEDQQLYTAIVIRRLTADLGLA